MSKNDISQDLAPVRDVPTSGLPDFAHTLMRSKSEKQNDKLVSRREERPKRVSKAAWRSLWRALHRVLTHHSPDDSPHYTEPLEAIVAYGLPLDGDIDALDGKYRVCVEVLDPCYQLASIATHRLDACLTPIAYNRFVAYEILLAAQSLSATWLSRDESTVLSIRLTTSETPVTDEYARTPGWRIWSRFKIVDIREPPPVAPGYNYGWFKSLTCKDVRHQTLDEELHLGDLLAYETPSAKISQGIDDLHAERRVDASRKLLSTAEPLSDDPRKELAVLTADENIYDLADGLTEL